MTQPNTEWKVLPHGPLTPVDADILTVTGALEMPLVDIPRRMIVVRLRDRGLVIYSAMALDDDAMRTIDAFGRPAWLVVPSDHHRLDAGAWKARYPAVRVATPSGAREKVEETVVVDTAAPDFGDTAVQFMTVPGTAGHEPALVVRAPTGTTLVVNDIVANIHGEHGFGGWLLRRMGFAGPEPQIPSTARLALIDHKTALKQQLLEWADDPSLVRILVSHGDPIDDDAAGVLRDLAADLD